MAIDRRTLLTGAGALGIGAALGGIAGRRVASHAEGSASPKSKTSVAPMMEIGAKSEPMTTTSQWGYSRRGTRDWSLSACDHRDLDQGVG